MDLNLGSVSTNDLEIGYLGTVALSVSAADDVTSDGQTATFTLVGNSGAPTGATLNGEDVGTLTDQGSGVYAYTSPLIADDATADLVVSVDSTTVSTQISYANSYPYELVTHGTPDANSIFFDTQFGVTSPVEWGVVTDYNASIVTVDHAAMDAAEDELNDVDLHSTEVAEGSSTATYKYFVPETGATGTWEATITVAAQADTTPAAFTFTDQTGVALSTLTESNAITVTGVDAGEDIAISVTGGEYAVDSGSGFSAFTSTSGTVQLNNQVKVRHTSSGSNSTTTDTVLTIGGVSDTFTTTTVAAADVTPSAFSFTDQANVEPESVGESNAITVSGVDAGEDIAVTITGGEYAVDAGSGFGAFTSTGTNVQLGYQIKVRNTASSDFETATNTTLTVGGVSDTFTRTTRAAVLPTLDVTLPDLNLGETDAVSIDLDNYFSGATSYTLTGIPTDSGLSFSGSVLSGNVNKDDIAASPFTLTATAISADGSINDAFSVTVVDDIGPVISIFPLTTLDTTPIVSGSAGDAVSLTLVVDGVTYTPTPSGGSWSQQLNELALDTYTMTLNGEDANGNVAVEAQATLQVVAELPSSTLGLIGPVITSALSPVIEDVIS